MRKIAVIFIILAAALAGAVVALLTEHQRKVEFLSFQHVSPTPSVAVEEKTPAPKGRQALAIESKGLAEFAPQNDTISNDSSQNKELLREMAAILEKTGDSTDKARNQE